MRVEECFYLDKELPPPLRNSPRYGFEIELAPKVCGFNEDYDKIFEYGDLESKCFSEDLLKEFYDRVGGKMVIGVDGGDNSVLELRSNPGTKQSQIRLMSKLLAQPLKTVYKNQDSNYGIHIHSDIRNYTPIEIYRNVRFMSNKSPKMSKFLNKIARRYTTEDYCGNQDYGFLNPLECMEKYCSETHCKESVRDGLYLQSIHDTHEFRIFNSTTDFVEGASCIDFVDALLRFCRNKAVFEECPDKFQYWVMENKIKFPYLATYLKGA